MFYKLRTIFHNLRNKYTREVIKKALTGYNFDHAYMLELELAKLNAMEDCFKRYGNTRCAQQVALAARILKKYLDDDYWTMVCTEEPDKDSDDFLERLGKYKYVCKVYVNLSNWKRFAKQDSALSYLAAKQDSDKEFFEEWRGELYWRKLWHLYCMIRERYMLTWWD